MLGGRNEFTMAEQMDLKKEHFFCMMNVEK